MSGSIRVPRTRRCSTRVMVSPIPADLYLEGSDQHRGWFQSSLTNGSGDRSAERPTRRFSLTGSLWTRRAKNFRRSRGTTSRPTRRCRNTGPTSSALGRLRGFSRGHVGLERHPQATDGGLPSFPKHLSVHPDFDQRLQTGAHGRRKGSARDRSLCSARSGSTWTEHPYRLRQIRVPPGLSFGQRVLHGGSFGPLPGYSQGSSLHVRAGGARASQRADHFCQILTDSCNPVSANGFTCEEAWQSLLRLGLVEEESVALSRWSDSYEEPEPELIKRWDRLFEIREGVNAAIEPMRRDRLLGTSLEASVDLWVASEADRSLLEAARVLPGGSDLLALFIVSGVEIHSGDAPEEAFQPERLSGVRVKVSKTVGEKCVRCWKYFPNLGSDPKHPDICDRCREAVEGL